MSDQYFQERAARRRRVIVVAGATAAVVSCAVALAVSLYYDACTRSFDRAPRSIVEVYLDAVGRGELAAAQECWEHQAYYDLGAGCSEVCLARVAGAGFQVQAVELAEPIRTAEGRSTLTATVTVRCAAGGPARVAEIWLDSVGSNLPWRHWAILRSDFGGTVAEPWCK